MNKNFMMGITAVLMSVVLVACGGNDGTAPNCGCQVKLDPIYP